VPTAVNKAIQGTGAPALRVLQTYLSRPAPIDLDHQMRAAEVIKMQQYLVTQGKFSAGNVNKSIDDQMLPAKIMELQVAANLP
jgi:hypothetical protein